LRKNTNTRSIQGHLYFSSRIQYFEISIVTLRLVEACQREYIQQWTIRVGGVPLHYLFSVLYIQYVKCPKSESALMELIDRPLTTTCAIKIGNFPCRNDVSKRPGPFCDEKIRESAVISHTQENQYIVRIIRFPYALISRVGR
jgi:hypothetical protein